MRQILKVAIVFTAALQLSSDQENLIKIAKIAVEFQWW